MKKINFLYIHPGPIYNPHLPNVYDRFFMLSEHSSGVILTWTQQEEFCLYKIGDFTFQAIILQSKNKLANRIKLGIFILIHACKYHFGQKKFDFIFAYDPVYTGILSIILKYLFRCKLLIELNTVDQPQAVRLEGKTNFQKIIKPMLFKLLTFISLSAADAIKMLCQKQKESLPARYAKKKLYVIHEYIPSHYFNSSFSTDSNVVLFVGHPFYRKGIDILIAAFQKISIYHKGFILKLIGHRIEPDVRKLFKGTIPDNIVVLNAMHYDKLKSEFESCYCFVLPSREEGMPRVLLEAMSCGKPVIGSRVCGIPEIIEDKKNGYLFQCEDIDDLASKLHLILNNTKRAQQMGMIGKQIVKQKFSSFKYCEYHNAMARDLVYQT